MRTYTLNTEKRKTLVTRITELTGVNLRYMGAPTYSYENDRYIVARDGSLQVKEGEEEMVRILLEEGLIVETLQTSEDLMLEPEDPEDSLGSENPEDGLETEHPAAGLEERDGETITADCAPAAPDPENVVDSLTISLPMEGHTPASLRNLINLVYSVYCKIKM